MVRLRTTRAKKSFKLILDTQSNKDIIAIFSDHQRIFNFGGEYLIVSVSAFHVSRPVAWHSPHAGD